MILIPIKDKEDIRKESFYPFLDGDVTREFDVNTLENVYIRLEKEKMKYKSFVDVYFENCSQNVPAEQKDKAYNEFLEQHYLPYEELQKEILVQFQKIVKKVFLMKPLIDIDENLKDKIFDIAWNSLFKWDKKWTYNETDIQNHIVFLTPFLQIGLLRDTD